ncbi:MAG: sigma-70 family RNA polymerase sigma factor [Clostridiales bacterium]
MERLTDEQLVAMIVAGDSQAFAQIVERYQKQIFALAYRLGGDYDEARDMAQEAFIQIYSELYRFDCSRRFFPWMYRVAHNCCVNLLQKRPPQQASIDEFAETQPTEAQEALPDKRFAKLELRETVNQALQALPEHYRVPLVLKYLEGLSYQEIGQYLDLPQTTIESRLFRGRIMLKKLLAPYLKEQ